MYEFQYAAPQTVEEAVRLMAQYGDRAVALAGGTDLLVQLREGQREAEMVVDIKRTGELMELEWEPNGELRIGAAVPCWRIYGQPDLAASFSALADATHIIGGWQIQARASVGGNLCNASPAADSIPPLMVHGAVAVVAGPEGRREVPVEQFCTAPGKNALRPGELLVALTLPAAAPRSGSAYQRFIPRNEMDIAVAGVASWVQLAEDGQTIQQARVAAAAVAPTPQLAEEASQWLVGKPAEEATYAEAGERAKRVVRAIDDMRGTVGYRTHLAGVLTKRTLARAVERAREGEAISGGQGASAK